MNDPHVVALRYSVSHDKSVTYKNPQPLEYKTLDFVVHAKDGRVRFEMQKHFSNIEAARDFVEPFVRAWEAEASLSFGPGQFEIRFGDAELEDRTPTLGIAQTRGTASGSSHASGSGIAVRDRYPAPPSDIAVNFEVEMMLARYSRYCQDRETLGAMANFCLTVLEGSKGRGRRAAAARKFSVDVKVLGTIGNLAGN